MTDAATSPSASQVRQRLTTNDQRLVSRARFAAPQDPYRAQSNVPVRRGVLRFRSCVRPNPPWRRYRSHPAARLKSRSLLLKEREHGSLFHHHAQPPEGGLLIPLPLDAQFVERLLIVRRELFFLDLPLEQLQVPDHEIRQIPQNRYLALDLPGLAQQLRQQQPPLPVHLDLLPVVVRPVQKFFLRRIEVGEPRQLLLDSLPFLEGIHLSNLAIQTCDVELLTVFLVDHPLELGRDLETALFVDPGWMVAAKHSQDPYAGQFPLSGCFCEPLPQQRGRSKPCKSR